jgi:GNAT superfamily N-acetyltransferase
MSDSSNDRSTTSLTIRTMTLEDAQAVAELSSQLGYEVSVKEIAERILQMPLNAEKQIAFVSCQGAEIVGWIEASLMTELQSPPYTLISGLVVREERRSLGIGKLLCAEIERWSRKHNVTLLRVTSRISREGAHRFYLREGFQRIKTWAVFEKKLS